MDSFSGCWFAGDLCLRNPQDEHRILGDQGLERSVDKIAGIERMLGVYDLEQFTPKS
jgi:hypothetical protein